MNKYFSLQLKRAFKLLPFVMLVTVLILAFASIVIAGFVGKSKADDSNNRFKIAITGDTEGDYIELGMTALQTLDDTRFAMDIIEMEQKEAEKALRKGEISAYVVLPEDFIERAIKGETDRVTYVTSSGSRTIVTLFKNEITKLITDLVVYNQKGIHAIGNVCQDYSSKKLASKNVNELSLEYVDLIFDRGKLCTLEELGISEGITLSEYYVCAVSIIFLTLIGISFATVYVKKDHALSSLLTSKGQGVCKQVLLESASHFLMLLIQLVAVLAIAISVWTYFLKSEIPYSFDVLTAFLIRLLVVTVLMTAFNTFMFEISGNFITSVLLYFFFSLGQCYISGCFYPLYALPLPLQKLSVFLPLGIGREYLEGAFLYEAKTFQLFALFAYTLIFLFGAIWIRKFKTVMKRG